MSSPASAAKLRLCHCCSNHLGTVARISILSAVSVTSEFPSAEAGTRRSACAHSQRHCHRPRARCSWLSTWAAWGSGGPSTHSSPGGVPSCAPCPTATWLGRVAAGAACSLPLPLLTLGCRGWQHLTGRAGGQLALSDSKAKCSSKCVTLKRSATSADWQVLMAAPERPGGSLPSRPWGSPAFSLWPCPQVLWCHWLPSSQLVAPTPHPTHSLQARQAGTAAVTRWPRRAHHRAGVGRRVGGCQTRTFKEGGAPSSAPQLSTARTALRPRHGALTWRECEVFFLPKEQNQVCSSASFWSVTTACTPDPWEVPGLLVTLLPRSAQQKGVRRWPSSPALSGFSATSVPKR